MKPRSAVISIMENYKRHVNIPVFIPHLGCPNMCVFCNQRTITGTSVFDPGSVRDIIDRAIETSGDAVREIAFFGGSFTGIDRALMISLLDIAAEYVAAGAVSSIRLSTRPDYVDGEILGILARYPVRWIELGLQSMCDRVLAASRRGHGAAAAEDACRRVKAAGFSLVGQMMIALPDSSAQDEIYTAGRICELGADAARVYPTVVFRQTALCEMTQSGEYTPPGDEEIIKRTSAVLRVFDSFGVPCIRVGLQATEALSDPGDYVAGMNAEATGELARGEIFYENMRAALAGAIARGDAARDVTFYVPRGAVSQAAGQNRRNTSRLRAEFALRRVKLRETPELHGYETSAVLDGGV